MPEDKEKIDEIFRLHEELERTASQKKIEESDLQAAAKGKGKAAVSALRSFVNGGDGDGAE